MTRAASSTPDEWHVRAKKILEEEQSSFRKEWCDDKECPLLSLGYWGHPVSSHNNSEVRSLFEVQR
jgi:hypothetical protein